MNYLILGNGGREHALAWKLSMSADVGRVYCMEGNGGTATTNKCVNVAPVPVHKVALWAKEHEVDCVVAGNESVLMEGVVDLCRAEGVAVFGPHKSAAMLEGSKVFAKNFMNTHKIRTAQHKVAASVEEARDLLASFPYPLVVKADGLAAGKGVIICQSKQEAERALEEIMVDKVFGSAGNTIVLEEYLDGFEASIIAIYDGTRIVPFLSAKDHKKIQEGEKGANTGGMGVVAPNPLFTQAIHQDFMHAILGPTERGLAAEGLQFAGFVFFGVMVVNKLCYLLEYNVRFGDPEAQALLPLLKSDLSQAIQSALVGNLEVSSFEWHSGSSCCVVLASAGYPAAYKTGYPIQGLEHNHEHVFCAGVEKHGTGFVTSGGRVLSVVGRGQTLNAARAQAYQGVEAISFEGAYYRNDIGAI